MLYAKDRKKKLALMKEPRIALLRQFGRDEDGSVIVLTFLLLIIMLVLGGMAVDFMRFESRRALLQSVTDRAVISVASLDQNLGGDDVNADGRESIIDFFTKAGFADAIVGEPYVDKNDSASSVRVRSELDVNTFYLRMIGIDTLSAGAISAAVQGTGNIEVSLVLDISGSMANNVTVTDENGVSRTDSKMAFLQEAATQFIDDLLLEDFEDRISVNLVAYSQQVALGDDLYRAIRTTPDSIDINDVTGSSLDLSTWTAEPEENVFTNPARCIDFRDSDFASTAFDTAHTYQQVEYFEHYRSGDAGIDYPVCPDKEFETILPLSQDATEIKRRINLYRPTSYTSIHRGVKWGITLLDPSMRSTLGGLSSVDPAFRNARPANYNSGETNKYLVVMTDGVNVNSRRIDRTPYYNTYAWQKTWSENPFDYWRSNNGYPSRDTYTDTPGSFTQFNTRMVDLCNLAKPNMTIYTIAMGAGDGADEIAKCATQPSYAFSTEFDSSADADEPGMNQIFSKIAEQINALRLNL